MLLINLMERKTVIFMRETIAILVISCSLILMLIVFFIIKRLDCTQETTWVKKASCIVLAFIIITSLLYIALLITDIFKIIINSGCVYEFFKIS